MPAYRSSHEAEIRDAVVARIRAMRPSARIIHEINVAGSTSNRVDVLAVSSAEIIAIEVKSAKDKLDRLPEQVRAMQGCAHHVIAALHEKFLLPGDYGHSAPDEARGSEVWIWPLKPRAPVILRGWDRFKRWDDLDPTVMSPLPPSAIHMLWRDELAALCDALAVSRPPRATMPMMVSALRWAATGGQLTKGICAALRSRKCIEADPEVAA